MISAKQNLPQQGFALLIVVVILMGLGGVLLGAASATLTSKVEENKRIKNRQILEEAKQALLFYAYKYSSFPGITGGPGHIPCPDIDNDGVGDNGCSVVGRFPWDHPNMDFYEAKDFSGETLWYAVSENFHNVGGGPSINSDSYGSLTLLNQNFTMIVDGEDTTPRNGIAAIIFAPGLAMGSQTRTLAADKIDAANYLDSFGGYGNNSFTNDESDSDDDGFVLGPVFNQNNLVINDEAIIVTVEELLNVAERSVLDSYRQSMEVYLENTVDVYPWLYNYDVSNLDSFPADTTFATELTNRLDNHGRIPSPFGEYFRDNDTQPITTSIAFSLPLTIPEEPALLDFLDSSSTSGTFQFNAAINENSLSLINVSPPEPFTNVIFEDFDAGTNVRLSGNNPGAPVTIRKYYWHDETGIDGVWRECVGTAGNVGDCNRTSTGPFGASPGGAHTVSIHVLEITVTLADTSITIESDYAINEPTLGPGNYASADGTQHATITGVLDIAALDLGTAPLAITYRYDQDYNSPGILLEESNGTIDIADLSPGDLSITMRYYPELPAWANTEGWYDSIKMDYADNLRPDSVIGTCTAGTDCMEFKDRSMANDFEALLTLGRTHDWVDNGVAGFSDDLNLIFESDNLDNDNIIEIDSGNDLTVVLR